MKITAQELLSQEVLLTTDELAFITKEQSKSIAVRRQRGSYPIPHVKIGSSVRYRSEDVRNFINRQNVVQPQRKGRLDERKIA